MFTCVKILNNFIRRLCYVCRFTNLTDARSATAHGQKSRTYAIALARKIIFKIATKVLCLMYEEFAYSRVYCY